MCYNPAMHVRTAFPLAVIVLLFAAVVLLWPSQEDRLTSEEELKRLVDGITDGQILYLRYEEYTQPIPGMTADDPFSHSESNAHTRGEWWWAQDAERKPSIYTNIVRNLNGEVVRYSRIEDGQEAHYDLIAVAQITMPVRDSLVGTDRVKGIWQKHEEHIREYTFVGDGQWDGQATKRYEEKLRHNVYYLYEHVVDRPFLYHSFTYEENESGERTPLSDYRVVEYRLLPADTLDIPQVSVTPCVFTAESLLEMGCMRFPREPSN